MGKHITAKLGEELFQFIKGTGRTLTLFDEQGSAVYNPAEALRFFIEPDKMMLSIQQDGADSSVKLYISDGVEVEDRTKDIDGNDSMSLMKFINVIRTICVRYNMLFNVRKYGHQLTPRNFAYLVAMESVMETKLVEGMYGTTKSSYQRFGGTRLIVRHSAAIDEQALGARSRKINALFIENTLGERYRYPRIHLNGARAMAYHVSQGGNFFDDVGKHISELSEQFYHLNQVRKYLKSNNLHESNKYEYELLETHLKELKSISIRVQRPRGYNWFKEQYQPVSFDDDFDIQPISERFGVDQQSDMYESLKWVAKLLTSQMGENSMNIMAEKEAQPNQGEDKFVSYARQYYTKRLEKAGERVEVSKELEQSAQQLALGLKQVLAGKLNLKITGKPPGSFKLPTDEMAFKIGMVLEPSSGMSNDALWNYLSDISDKLTHGEALTPNEKLISNKIKDLVDSKLTTEESFSDEETFIEGETFVEEQSCDDDDDEKEEEVKEHVLPEIKMVEEWFDQFDPTAILSKTSERVTEGPYDTGATPYDDEPSDADIDLLETYIDECIANVVADPHSYHIILSQPEHEDEPGKINQDFVSDVVGAVIEKVKANDVGWEENYAYDHSDDIGKRVIEAIKKLHPNLQEDVVEDTLSEMPANTHSFSTSLPQSNSIVTTIKPSDVMVLRAAWNFRNGSDKVWAILKCGEQVITAWGKRETNLSGARNWRHQPIPEVRALDRYRDKLNNGYVEFIKNGIVLQNRPGMAGVGLGAVLTFLKDVGARIFRQMDLSATDGIAIPSTESVDGHTSTVLSALANETDDSTFMEIPSIAEMTKLTNEEIESALLELKSSGLVSSMELDGNYWGITNEGRDTLGITTLSEGSSDDFIDDVTKDDEDDKTNESLDDFISNMKRLSGMK